MRFSLPSSSGARTLRQRPSDVGRARSLPGACQQRWSVQVVEVKEDDGSGRGPKVGASIRLARQVRSAGLCFFWASHGVGHALSLSDLPWRSGVLLV